jgi:oligopeptide/dipeptide ABC transporter ATP-binding protein
MLTDLLNVNELRVTFRKGEKLIKALGGVTFNIKEGEIFGLIGESGSGKSVTALSIMRLLDNNAEVQAKWLKFKDKDLLSLSEKEMQKIRGNKISMIFQDPMTSLNPAITVGRQIEESLIIHQGMSFANAKTRACELMEIVTIPDPHSNRSKFPHEFSGGMRQRLMIAMALSCNPLLVIADEPTTALDVTVQAQILELLKNLVKQFKISVLLITHDFGVIAELCDKVSVIYGGTIMEHAPIEVILKNARHPYTIGLLNCVVPLEKGTSELEVIRGSPPDPSNFPPGCRFNPRCNHAKLICSKEVPPLKEIEQNHFIRCFL